MGELKEHLDGVLLDIRFGDEGDTLGLDIIKGIRESYPELPIVMMTSVPKEELLSRCLELGAVDYLVKPLQPDLLWQTLDRYVGTSSPKWWLVGQSEEFSNAVDMVAMASEGGATSVLLLGESGTGKELFARYLHRHGPRSSGPFQAIQISALSESSIEGDLFGYSRGAFTGADRNRDGQLCEADGGVLFLDEIGDLSLPIQAKLLRMLETREVPRLGDGKLRKIDVQVVAATNANLSARVKENTFRLDLYKRLGGMIIRLPPISDRPNDILLMVRHLLCRGVVERMPGMPVPELPEQIVDELNNIHWDGNVRDIWNFIQSVFDLATREKDFSATVFRKALKMADHGFSDTPQIELSTLPKETVNNSDIYLEKLALQELSLLYSALQETRDARTGAPNRASAAAMLKGKEKSSTNEFDRWVQNIMKKLNPDTQATICRAYPELVNMVQERGQW